MTNLRAQLVAWSLRTRWTPVWLRVRLIRWLPLPNEAEIAEGLDVLDQTNPVLAGRVRAYLERQHAGRREA